MLTYYQFGINNWWFFPQKGHSVTVSGSQLQILVTITVRNQAAHRAQVTEIAISWHYLSSPIFVTTLSMPIVVAKSVTVASLVSTPSGNQ